MRKTVTGYLKSLSNKELDEVLRCGLFDDMKLPELKKKVTNEINRRKNEASVTQLELTAYTASKEI